MVALLLMLLLIKQLWQNLCPGLMITTMQWTNNKPMSNKDATNGFGHFLLGFVNMHCKFYW